MTNVQTKRIADGCYLRGKSVQIKISVRGGGRYAVKMPCPKYGLKVKRAAVELRAALQAATDNPGTNDDLLRAHLSPEWLARLGVESFDRPAPTLETAVSAHMARYETAGKNTRLSANRECNAVIARFGASKLVSSFEHEFSAVRDWITAPGKSAQWRKKCGGRLKMILEDARRDGVLATHPLISATWWRDFQPARTDHNAALRAALDSTTDKPTDNRTFSNSEVETLLATPSARTDEHALMWLGFNTGLRCGELYALAAEDLDFDAGVIHVRWNFTSGALGLPKFNKTRLVPMPADTFRLRQQVRKYEGNPVTVPVTVDGETVDVTRTFLFRNTAPHTNAARRRLEIGSDILHRGFDSFRRFFWKPHLEAAGVDYRPPYGMRHTFATNAIANGWDYRDLAAVLGHADPHVTRRRYVRERAEDELARIERLRSLTGRALKVAK